MPFPALLLPLLAAAAAAPEPPINVVGHAWAPFISPMGEPFRAKTAADDTLADWFYRADRNRDGFLTIDEMQADADRFFATLDANHDGQIDPDELVHYEWEIAPDIQLTSRTMRAPGSSPPVKTSGEKHRRGPGGERDYDTGLQGAARYSLLNMPEPVAAADTDFNRAITLAEFRAAAITRFQLLDGKRSGRIALADLESMRPAPTTDRQARRGRTKDSETVDKRVGNPLPPENQAP